MAKLRDYVLKSWMTERAGDAVSVRHLKGRGVLIQRDKGYWASVDEDWALVGLMPNQKLQQPTVGPFRTLKEAFEAFESELPIPEPV